MPIAEVIIPEIQKTPITREIVHGHGVSWGRSTTTVDDCATQEEDATPVA